MISIPAITPSQNQWDKMHWATRYELRNEWFLLVRSTAGVRSPAMGEKCDVRFVRVAKRLIDPLNVPAALKPCLDALVHYGHLRGDTAKDIVVTTDQRKCGACEEPHTEVSIMPT